MKDSVDFSNSELSFPESTEVSGGSIQAECYGICESGSGYIYCEGPGCYAPCGGPSCTLSTTACFVVGPC